MSRRSPRLLFSDEELAAPELKKVIKRVDKRMAKLEKAEAKIPKKTVKMKRRVIDPQTGKVTTRLSFEEFDKEKPPSKLTHAVRDAPINTLSAQFHREMREYEQDNVGVESAHKLEETAEGGVRLARSARRSHQLKPYRAADRAEVRVDRANIKALDKAAQRQNPQFSSNPYSRWQQKQTIKKEYAAAKFGKGAKSTIRASETTAKAAKKAAEETRKAGAFVARHKKALLIIGGIAALTALIMAGVSSCSVLFQGGASGVGISTYPSEDADMLAAEATYAGMETDLQYALNNYETLHPGYDEYIFDLDDISHDPFVLISIITAIQGGKWMIDEIGGMLQTLFNKQYILTENITVETRRRTEQRTDYYPVQDPNTGAVTYVPYTYTVQVPYDYRICAVTLENLNLSHVPAYIMSEEQLSMYAIYMSVLGNRPDLFAGNPNTSALEGYME